MGGCAINYALQWCSVRPAEPKSTSLSHAMNGNRDPWNQATSWCITHCYCIYLLHCMVHNYWFEYNCKRACKCCYCAYQPLLVTGALFKAAAVPKYKTPCSNIDNLQPFCSTIGLVMKSALLVLGSSAICHLDTRSLFDSFVLSRCDGTKLVDLAQRYHARAIMFMPPLVIVHCWTSALAPKESLDSITIQDVDTERTTYMLSNWQKTLHVIDNGFLIRGRNLQRRFADYWDAPFKGRRKCNKRGSISVFEATVTPDIKTEVMDAQVTTNKGPRNIAADALSSTCCFGL